MEKFVIIKEKDEDIICHAGSDLKIFVYTGRQLGDGDNYENIDYINIFPKDVSKQNIHLKIDKITPEAILEDRAKHQLIQDGFNFYAAKEFDGEGVMFYQKPDPEFQIPVAEQLNHYDLKHIPLIEEHELGPDLIEEECSPELWAYLKGKENKDSEDDFAF
ncbi:hypothetical protein [Mucilaginibacter endophyticus]|uniref:hypothetical protein n=1 Tax=Mucilaginibacter endophyticus TaxID=2675003 RepID=UPI000E0CD5F2|nr:hypothetical protein [Mucilaginibacter endophyticus]